jgi:uncharacterized protein (TIGR03435 family)
MVVKGGPHLTPSNIDPGLALLQQSDVTYARNLREALEPELGLRLEYGKAKTDVLVIDKASRTPSAN